MLKVYTDGACKGNPGTGGWGIYIENTNEMYAGTGYKNTTNNIMELTAIIRALEATESCVGQVEILSDSVYCVKGINEWLQGWKKKNWTTSSGTTVKNKDLWQRIDTLKRTHRANLTFTKVKAHCGIRGNEIADKLATGELKC